MRSLRIALAAVTLAVVASGAAMAGDLVPGGWLSRHLTPPPPPPTPPAPPVPQASAPDPAPKPHHTAVHHHRPAAPRPHEATTPAPPNNGMVRF